MVRAWILPAGLLVAIFTTWTAISPAADTAKQPAEAVGLFEAIAAGDLDARLFVKDSTAGTVILANKTRRPLAIVLPEALAGVPVAAQFGVNPFGVNPVNNNGAGNGNQTVGMAPQNPWANNGPGPNPGFFNIGPEKAIKVKLVAVCLEHGKKEPISRLAYELAPLSSFTSDKRVAEIVSLLGRGEIDQPAAQAAAWHLTDGLSWQQLGKKIGIKHLAGGSEPYFTTGQIERAKKAVDIVGRRSATGQSES
jgi:hypothetical protein